MPVVGRSRHGRADDLAGFHAVDEACEAGAASGLQREHPFLGRDGLAGGEADCALRAARHGAGHDVTALSGTGDGGEDVGMRDVAPRGVAGCAFQHGHGEHRVALGDVLGREGERPVGRESALVGRGNGQAGRAGLGVGDEGAAHFLGEAERVGLGAPGADQFALVDLLLGRPGVERGDGLLGRRRGCAGLAARVQRGLDLRRAAGETLPHIERHAVDLERAVLVEGDGVAELDDFGSQGLVVDAAQFLLEPVEVAALDAAPLAVRAHGHVEDDAVGVNLGGGHVVGRPCSHMREGGDDEIVGRDAFHLFAVAYAGDGRLALGVGEGGVSGAVLRVEQAPVACDQRQHDTDFGAERVRSHPGLCSRTPWRVVPSTVRSGSRPSSMAVKVSGATSPSRPRASAPRPCQRDGALPPWV